VCKSPGCQTLLRRRLGEDAGNFKNRVYCNQTCFDKHRKSKIHKEARERALTRLAEKHVTEFLAYMKEELAKEAS
jgi:hypothetical protein